MFFHTLIFAGSRGSWEADRRPIGGVLKHLPRDPASVNAMKQTCVIVILAYFTLYQPNYTPTKRSNAQHLVEYLKKPCSLKKIKNRGMSYNSLWIPGFVV